MKNDNLRFPVTSILSRIWMMFSTKADSTENIIQLQIELKIRTSHCIVLIKKLSYVFFIYSEMWLHTYSIYM